ncbi:hypothetical protein [Halorubrum distributum]|uniref:hypothetical protein n=1 Tax=Halorubrum distributum TaxID=29283 RepID=UPI0009B5A33A|nr:hypothetical protein [Halorubrum arcis]
MNRRSYLTLGLAASVSGCLAFSNNEIFLGGLRVENGGEIDRSIEIRILKNGNSVHETTVDISGMGKTDDGQNVLGAVFVECEWPSDDRGRFEVAARLAENDSWTETASSDVQSDDQCQMLFLRIEPTGSIWFSWDDCERYETENPNTVCEYGTE